MPAERVPGQRRGGAISSGASLTGTAAVGAPLTNATITVKDRNGLQATGATDANGKYTINVSTLTAPFLLKVTAAGNPDRYSVGSQSGIVNLTPLTDMVVRNYYRARGLDVVTVFNALSTGSPIPTADEVALLVNQTKTLIARSMADNGVAPDGYDFITTAFDANNAGIDAVLAASTLTDNGTTMTLTIAAGGISQTSQVTADSVANSVNTTTTVTAGTSTSASASSTLVPATSNALAALAGVNASLTQLKNIVNAQGGGLTSAHVAALIAPGAQMEGLTAAQLPGQLVSDLRGRTFVTMRATAIRSYDDVNKVIDVDAELVESTGGGLAEQPFTMQFKQVGSNWLLFGDQRLAAVGLSAESNISHDGVNGTVATKKVTVDFRAPQGLIDVPAGVRVTCPTAPTVFNNTLLSNQGTSSITYQPTTNSADNFTVTSDFFFAEAIVAAYPPPGTVCNITFTPLGGVPVIYSKSIGATTSETTTLTTAPGGFAIGSVAGQNVTMTWTLPSTFRVTSIQTAANAQNSFGGNTFVGEVLHGPTTTSRVIAIPATVAGQPTTQTTLNLGYNGPNGERIQHLYSYN